MKYRSANIDEKGMLFGKWCSMPGVWTLTNRWQNFMFLIVGEEKAMLIDTGYGEGNLREIVEGITDKPVMVVDTHGHFDHTGGNAWWTDVWMAEGADVYKRQVPALWGARPRFCRLLSAHSGSGRR